jgi:hypothetical protein
VRDTGRELVEANLANRPYGQRWPTNRHQTPSSTAANCGTTRSKKAILTNRSAPQAISAGGSQELPLTKSTRQVTGSSSVGGANPQVTGLSLRFALFRDHSIATLLSKVGAARHGAAQPQSPQTSLDFVNGCRDNINFDLPEVAGGTACGDGVTRAL